MSRQVGLTTPMVRVLGLALLAGGYSCLSLLKGSPPFVYVPEIPAAIDAALSVAMAMVLAFRVNRAYERWWEARTLWGTLVNVSRNLAIKIRELVAPDEEDRQAARDTIVAFCLGLKDHLRDTPQLGNLPGFEGNSFVPKHLPSHVARQLYRQFSQWQAEEKLSEQQLWVLDSDARVLLDVCGGCERIKTTLMSVSWRFFTWQCIALYLLVLPWGLVDDFGAWTVPLTTLIAYFVMAGEGIAHYVEEPFGLHEDHLDLEAICQGIDRSVSEILDTKPEAI
ncbi:MAG: bestrophin [Planctomycetes bacterium]|nr:bestrophin [Planctomycetota bacterium]